MNTPLPPDPGPFGSDTDDAVTALIDGELAGFAAERGLDVESVHASLTAWGGLPARRAYLERAVTAMQAPVTLEPSERDALVATALRATPEIAPVASLSRRRRPARIASWVAAAAVLAILVVGAAVLLRPADPGPSRAGRAPEPTITVDRNREVVAPVPAAGNPGSVSPGNPESAAGSTGVTTPAVPPTVGPQTPPVAPSALGEISDPKTLISKVQPLVPSGATPPSDPMTTTLQPVMGSGPCPTTGLFPNGSVVVLDTTGTFNGNPAQVVAAQQNGRTFVYVLNPSGCSVLSAVSF